jgi:hypothetical protein
MLSFAAFHNFEHALHRLQSKIKRGLLRPRFRGDQQCESRYFGNGTGLIANAPGSFSLLSPMM